MASVEPQIRPQMVGLVHKSGHPARGLLTVVQRGDRDCAEFTLWRQELGVT